MTCQFPFSFQNGLCVLYKQVQHFSALAFVYNRGEKHCIILNVTMNEKTQLFLCNKVIQQSFLFSWFYRITSSMLVFLLWVYVTSYISMKRIRGNVASLSFAFKIPCVLMLCQGNV